MAIYELTAAEVVQRCASCSRVNRLDRSGLAVGSVTSTAADPNIVILPQCACGATEFLVRSPEGDTYPNPGSFGHLHRLLVDELHAELVQAGKIKPNVGPITARPVPPATLQQWFPNGLSIPLPSGEGAGAG